MKALLWLLAAITVAAAPLTATAKCGFGLPPSYADISAVMLRQAGCDGTLHAKPVTSLNCSTFWALFWYGQPTEYAQYTLPGKTGFYRLSKSVREVRNILQQDSFFSLSPPDLNVTDTAKSVLSVKRCGVITRIQIYNSPRFVDAATAMLFTDLVRFIEKAPAKKISSDPADFKYTLLFDP